MEKIQDYQTKKGWQTDWDKTKARFNGLIEKVYPKSEFEDGEHVYDCSGSKFSSSGNVSSFEIHYNWSEVIGYDRLRKKYLLRNERDKKTKPVSRKDICNIEERGKLAFFGM